MFRVQPLSDYLQTNDRQRVERTPARRYLWSADALLPIVHHCLQTKAIEPSPTMVIVQFDTLSRIVPKAASLNCLETSHPSQDVHVIIVLDAPNNSNEIRRFWVGPDRDVVRSRESRRWRIKASPRLRGHRLRELLSPTYASRHV